MKFSYLVKPKIPIRALPEHGPILRSKILDLDKDEVLKCLRFGPVFRRFADGEQVKVTKDNIDQVHVTRLQYKGVVEPKIAVDPVNDKGLVSNPNTPDETKVNSVAKMVGFGQPVAPAEKVEEKEEKTEPVKAEAPVEEKKAEEAVSEEKKEEAPVVSEPVKAAEKEEKVSEDAKVEEPTEEKAEDEKAAQNQNNGNKQNFNKNNKKH